ncbi:mucin-2-like [Planococcus citri]|uniref:mucin-2-like n=1 Tax=Planococcus citri TaxID=170843 RepID=UPI0031F73C82
MLREMIPLLLLFLKIVLSGALADDNVQQSQLPDGKICLFTCSEWIFKEKVLQFAPSADLLGPGYLSKHKIGFSSDDCNTQGNNDAPLQYQKVWGAVYSIDKTEYDAVLKQSRSEYSVPFESNEDVFVVKYNEMNCLVVDLGIQPGDHPPWRHFNMKIPNTIEDDAYYNRLAQIGVPQEYIKGLRNSSIKPQYHPIIPQDYHPRQDNQQPKRTYDQLPVVPAHQYNNVQPTTGVPSVNIQPNTRKLLPGVPNPNSPPSVISNTPGYVQGQVPLTNVQPGSHDVQVVVPKDIDAGVAQTPDGQPVVAITPMKLPGSSNVQSGPNDVQIAVPKEIDSGVTHTPDGQPVVLITPLKLPGSTTAQPVMAQPATNVQHSSPVIVPGKNVDSNVVVPPNGHVVRGIDNAIPTQVTGVGQPTSLTPTISGTPQTPSDDQSYVVITPLNISPNKNLNSVPVGQDYKVQTPTSLQPNEVQPSFSRPEDVPPMLLGGPKQQTQVIPDYATTGQPTVTQQQPQNHLLLSPDTVSPPRLPVQAPGLLNNPSYQIGNEPVPTLPTSYDIPCDNGIPGSDSGLLTLSPDSNLTPNYQNDSPLLTLNDAPSTTNSFPTQQVGNPSLLVGQPQNSNPTVIPHQKSVNPVVLHNNPNHLQTNTIPDNVQPHTAVDHPIYRLPDSFSVSKPAPILPKNPMFGFEQTQPNHVITHDAPCTTPVDNQPLLVSHQPTANVVNPGNSPDVLLTNTGPDHLQVHPTGDQTLHQIPESFAVPKPSPVVSDKPMFTLNQPNCVDHQSPDYYQINPHTLEVNNNPDLLNTNTAPNHVQLRPDTDHTIIQTPSSQQLTPHTLDVNHPDVLNTNTAPNHLQLQPTSPNSQIIPKSLEVNNPDLLNTNTAPNHMQIQPHGDHTVHSIPTSPDVSKPIPVIPEKPMFGFNHNNYPPSAIPATFGISSQPPVVQDKPMFSLGRSPSTWTPKHIDDDLNIPPSTSTIPVQPVDQPHSTGLLTSHPDQLVSPPPNVALTPTTPDSHTVQVPNHIVDNSHPVLLTSQPTVVNDGNPAPVVHQIDNAPLTATTPDDHIVHVPNQIVENGPSATVIPPTSTLQAPNHVVTNGNPATLVTKPDNVAITPTASPTIASHPTITQNDHPDQLISQQPHNISSQPTNIASPVQAPTVPSQPIHQVSPPAYTPSTFMAPNYTPVSPALGYTFAYRYPQYIHNSNYKPPNCYYQPDELIPGFTFGSHIQLY